MMTNFGDFAVTAIRNMLFVKMFPKYTSRAHTFSGRTVERIFVPVASANTRPPVTQPR